MSDTTERNAVRAEFYARHGHGFRTLAAVRAAVKDAMADEIVRLRAENAALRAEIDRLLDILAALREPSEAVVDAALTNLYPGIDRSTRRMYLTPFLCNTPREAIRAAVAAAEQEVGRE